MLNIKQLSQLTEFHSIKKEIPKRRSSFYESASLAIGNRYLALEESRISLLESIPRITYSEGYGQDNKFESGVRKILHAIGGMIEKVIMFIVKLISTVFAALGKFFGEFTSLRIGNKQMIGTNMEKDLKPLIDAMSSVNPDPAVLASFTAEDKQRAQAAIDESNKLKAQNGSKETEKPAESYYISNRDRNRKGFGEAVDNSSVNINGILVWVSNGLVALSKDVKTMTTNMNEKQSVNIKVMRNKSNLEDLNDVKEKAAKYKLDLTKQNNTISSLAKSGQLVDAALRAAHYVASAKKQVAKLNQMQTSFQKVIKPFSDLLKQGGKDSKSGELGKFLSSYSKDVMTRFKCYLSILQQVNKDIIQYKAIEKQLAVKIQKVVGGKPTGK